MMIETEAAYSYVAQRIVKKYLREKGLEKVNEIDFMRWMEQHCATLEGATVRQYRSALSYYFEKIGRHNLSTEVTTLKSGPKKEDREKLTSAKKRKTIPYEDLKSLLEEINRRKMKKKLLLQAFIACSLMTGLRPVEWNDARIVDLDGTPALKVRNAKSTQGRSHGEFRHILLKQGYGEQDIATIKWLTEQARGPREQWMKELERLRDVMRRLNEKLFPRRRTRYTLYTFRHQFIANLKKIRGYSPREIAALVGHGTDETANRHYGRKDHGWNPHRWKYFPTPLERELLRIRLKLNMKEKPNLGPRFTMT